MFLKECLRRIHVHFLGYQTTILLFTLAVSGTAADNAGFRRSVQPFLAAHCTSCHNAKAKVANLDLEKFKNTNDVLANQDVWDKVVTKLRNGEMPPKPIPAPKPEEISRLTDWLHREYAQYDKSPKHDPGRVTARRLNRAEYNNTIRDLTGLDLHPADEFPPDDSGYGFDNIGDVLSLSPALMEKYITAAMKITKAAIATPRTFKETSDRYRVDRTPQPGPPGSMQLRHNFPAEADYSIRIAIAGRRATEEEGLQISAEIDGQKKIFSAFTPQNRPRVLDWNLRLGRGAPTIRAYFTDKESAAIKEDKGLLIEYIEIRGPRNVAPFVAPVSHQRILICGEWPGKYDDACMKQIIETFARRAFRRPLTEQEKEKLVRYAVQAKQDGETPEQALRYALQAVLVSPHFLFRVEHDPKPNDPGATHQVTDLELATRLSYFLWSSMPDEELYKLAVDRKLRKPGIMEQQVSRMMADSKFAGFVDNFLGQWLELRNLDEIKPAPEKFPQFDDALRQAMKKETQLFFTSIIRENGSLLDLLDAKYTFLNERLAKHYGIPGVTGDEFRRVDLNTPQRGGVLTQASLLTVTSYPNRTSPVLRGKFLLDNFLNAPPPPPPPNIPTLEESAGALGGTLRQQMQKHRSNAMCASCHVKMDALGFGLENFDAIGTWRESDGGQNIDASGSLPGARSFSTPAELRKILTADKDDFTICLTDKLLTYALGRGLEKNDRTFLRQIAQHTAASGYKLQTMLLEITKSPAFQMRRGERAASSGRDKVSTSRSFK